MIDQTVIGDIPLIDSPEELEATLGVKAADPTPAPAPVPAKGKGKEAVVKDEDEEETFSENEKGEVSFGKKGPTKKEEGKGDGKKEEGKEGEGDKKDPYLEQKIEVPKSILSALNQKYDFNWDLNREVTRGEEIEAVTELIDNVVKGSKEKLEEFSHIQELLDSDEDLKQIIQGKLEGKSIRDLFPEIGRSIEQGDEALAITHFRKNYPYADDESIGKMVDSLKGSGKFDTFVKGLKDQIRNQEVQSERERAINEANDLKVFKEELSSIDSVVGVPFTNEMKSKLYEFVTKKDKDGNTQYDRLVQSDNQALIKAAMGILYMDKLVDNKASILTNKRRKSFLDTLSDSPKPLQGGGTGAGEDEGKPDYSLANEF